MSLYRYFPDRDPIAFEIAVRMLRRICYATEIGEQPINLEFFRNAILRMIDQFFPLRDAFRYISMFDHLYGTHYPNEQLASWFKEQIFELGWGAIIAEAGRNDVIPAQAAMIGNSTMSFLEKMAVRGDLMAGEQDVPLADQMTFYKDMVNDYFDKMERESKERM